MSPVLLDKVCTLLLPKPSPLAADVRLPEGGSDRSSLLPREALDTVELVLPLRVRGDS